MCWHIPEGTSETFCRMAEEAPPPKRIKEMQTYSTVSQRIMVCWSGWGFRYEVSGPWGGLEVNLFRAVVLIVNWEASFSCMTAANFLSLTLQPIVKSYFEAPSPNGCWLRYCVAAGRYYTWRKCAGSESYSLNSNAFVNTVPNAVSWQEMPCSTCHVAVIWQDDHISPGVCEDCWSFWHIHTC